MELKIKVLTQLSDATNYSAIIREMSALVGPYNPDLSRLSIRAIGQIAVKASLHHASVVSAFDQAVKSHFSRCMSICRFLRWSSCRTY